MCSIINKLVNSIIYKNPSKKKVYFPPRETPVNEVLMRRVHAPSPLIQPPKVAVLTKKHIDF